MGKVPGHEDAHPFTVVVLCKGDKGRQDLLPQQDYGDDGEDLRCLGPREIRADEGVYGVHRLVQDDCVDLLHEGSHQREQQGDGYKDAVRLYERPYFLEKFEKVHFLTGSQVRPTPSFLNTLRSTSPSITVQCI